MVVTDRISCFDVILPKPIPFKGQILNQIAQQTGIRYVSMLEWAKSHEILRDKVQKIEDLRKDGHTKEANRLAKEIRGDGIHYKGMSAQYYAETVASNIGDYSGITGTGNVMIPGVTISRPATRKGKFVHGISPIEKFKFEIVQKFLND